MNKLEFSKRFHDAVEKSITFARGLVLDEIPDAYLINLYYADRSRSQEDRLRLSLQEAADSLYRNGKIPTWIRIGVAMVDKTQRATIISCDYSDIFVNDDSKLSFFGTDEKFVPFKIGGPRTKHKQAPGVKFALEPFDENDG